MKTDEVGYSTTANMRRGEGLEMLGPDRERRTRQLRLVLKCAGPGSVTGSRSSQCRREGRPHGGYKGLSSQYPLSRPGFDKEEFMEEVRNSVNAEYKEEQKCHTNSPQWLPAANKEKNHTGEQPLILQNFLAPNKQEQIEGVLPAPIGKRQSKSADVYRDDPDYFCRGNSTHQYLTATEMPGQSERLVDLTLGRPTRTSLLRVRQRTKSAPGVRAIVEIKSHLHKQQHLAAKTEERYKSIDVPQDLLPVTEDHETVHQFLIGARYNRMHHHDAKCLNKLGLFVSRHDPLHCFKMNVPAKDQQLPSNLIANMQGSISTLNLTDSCESFGSESNLNELTALSSANQEPPSPQSAWSTMGQEDDVMVSKGTVKSATPAPSPSPANRSRERFTSSRVAGWKNRPKLKVIDGRSLTSHKRKDDGHQCCVMCRSEEPAKYHQRFAPGSHFARVRDAGKEEQDGDWNHNEDHMLVQQYHLRIMGIKYGLKSGPQAPPRSNLLYATKKSANITELPSIKQPKTFRSNRNNNGNVVTPQTENQALAQERPPSNSSKISVRISNHEEKDEKVPPPEDTPRTVEKPEGAETSKDSNNNPAGPGAATGDEPTQAGLENQAEVGHSQMKDKREQEVTDDALVGDDAETQDNHCQDATGEDRPKETSDLENDALMEPDDAQAGDNQDAEGLADTSGDNQDIKEQLTEDKAETGDNQDINDQPVDAVTDGTGDSQDIHGQPTVVRKDEDERKCSLDTEEDHTEMDKETSEATDGNQLEAEGKGVQEGSMVP